MTAVKRLMTGISPLIFIPSNRLQSIGSSQTTLPPEFSQADLPHPIAISVLNVAGPVDESNFFEWECYISGPEGTPFEGGVFPATLSFPKVLIHFIIHRLIPSPGLSPEPTHNEICL